MKKEAKVFGKEIVGKQIKLVFMDDPYSELQPGETGTVSMVDDAGIIHVDWDNGSKLGIIQGIDEFEFLN